MRIERFEPGDPVEVLIKWAHGCPAHWFGGYVVVAGEDHAGRVRLLDTSDHELSGERLYHRCAVRLRVMGPRAPEDWQKRPPWHWSA